MSSVVVVGGGGREHAMARALAESPSVSRVFVTQVNLGTAAFCEKAPEKPDELTAFCQAQKVRLVVVGPEQPLAEGLADVLRAADIAVLGPSKAAAQLESSKSFARAFMQRHHIPAPKWKVFDDEESARDWIRRQKNPPVLKADGLAAGKGVAVCETAAEAEAAAAQMFGGAFGAAGRRVLAEEQLRGREMSFFALCDGAFALPLASCQDYKRLRDDNVGPNTGGMGARSPSPLCTPQVAQDIMARVVLPTLRGMREEGAPFSGFLYVGLMFVDDDFYVLEFNARLGDPEAQVMLPRLRGDFFLLCEAAAKGELQNFSESLTENGDSLWRDEEAVGVVLAAEGYPDSPKTGAAVSLPNEDSLNGARLYCAGANVAGEVSGGRVLCVVATGENTAAARGKAYAAAEKAAFANCHYRRDIGAD